MNIAKKHWKILQGLGADLTNKVRSFMVIGERGEGLLMATEDGMAYWFGEMQFGLGWITAKEPTALDVPGLVSMASGECHILLLNRRGEIFSMGENNYGQLGLGTVDQEIRFTPQLISIPSHKFISVRCGEWHSLALTDDGKVWGWGWNRVGQVGVPSSTDFHPSPHQISHLDCHRIVAVECGFYHSLALTDQGEVYVWGANDCGQLGNGSVNLDGWIQKYQNPPNRILTPSPVRSIAAGSHHTLLLTQTGEVYACGSNGCGELGLPNDTIFGSSLTKVVGLPLISQIAAHPVSSISIAMSFEKQCFVWGELANGKFDEEDRKLYISVSRPMKLPPNFSTVESPLSFYSSYRNTPHSVQVSETPPNLLSTRMSRMFDNPETSDVQFVVEQRTIHAHRNILSNLSDYFKKVQVDPEDLIVKVITIPDHSYGAFHAFLRYLYTDCFEVNFGILPELFELATQYLVPELQQLCLSRMRMTLIPATCCLYYPLAHRHNSLLADFHEDIVGFAFSRMSEVVESAAYQSMEPDLRDNLANEVLNFPGTLFGHFQSQFLD